ncbi:MAG: MaoC family dehydratase [Pirellulales bacterium]|nr:MaoC family dehydratase [Pirellulales bacterium]
MTVLSVERPEDLEEYIGREIGATSWTEVTQQQVDAFADATGDRQWIHCDPKRAKQESPYGATIAHGFFTLSLIPRFLMELVSIKDLKMAINYGLNRLRFPNAVPVGAHVRMVARVADVLTLTGAVQAVFRVNIEVKGQQKPACVAEMVMRFCG